MKERKAYSLGLLAALGLAALAGTSLLRLQ